MKIDLTTFPFFVCRKSCKNCKCPRDGHEVIAEHGARSRLGFITNNDGLDARSLGYTFVPPGLSTARQVSNFLMKNLLLNYYNIDLIFLQVEYYYGALPTIDVPKMGSKGETIRSQRIVKQLPKQDLDLAACKFVELVYANSYKVGGSQFICTELS